MQIALGINQFVRNTVGDSLPKDARIGSGGGYVLEDLPEGSMLTVVSEGTHDSVGAFHEGSGERLFYGTREEIAAWNEEENGWF
jgi:hypothetical protein